MPRRRLAPHSAALCDLCEKLLAEQAASAGIDVNNLRPCLRKPGVPSDACALCGMPPIDPALTSALSGVGETFATAFEGHRERMDELARRLPGWTPGAKTLKACFRFLAAEYSYTPETFAKLTDGQIVELIEAKLSRLNGKPPAPVEGTDSKKQDAPRDAQRGESVAGATPFSPPVQVDVNESSDLIPGEWMPVSQAIERADKRGHPIASSFFSKQPKKHGVVTRSKKLPGNHKLEVEWQSLSAYLLKRDGDREPQEGDQAEIENRIANERKKKIADRSSLD